MGDSESYYSYVYSRKRNVFIHSNSSIMHMIQCSNNIINCVGYVIKNEMHMNWTELSQWNVPVKNDVFRYYVQDENRSPYKHKQNMGYINECPLNFSSLIQNEWQTDIWGQFIGQLIHVELI